MKEEQWKPATFLPSETMTFLHLSSRVRCLCAMGHFQSHSFQPLGVFFVPFEVPLGLLYWRGFSKL